VVCLRHLSDEFLSKYGVVVPSSPVEQGYLVLGGAVEKPGIDEAPSRLGLVGRYLFTPEVFELLDRTQPGSGGEIQLTDAIDGLGKAGRLRGYVADVDLLDVGTPLGLLEASVVLGADQFGEEFTTWLEGRAGS
jgi:UTP--glucose-1-phosphate uridylyltransferase